MSGSDVAVEQVIEFSREIRRESLDQGVAEEHIEATESERAALAERLGLVAIKAFDAKVRVHSKRGGQEIHLKGTMKAEVTQTCSVTLEPFDSIIEADYVVVFAEKPEETGRESEGVDLDTDDIDIPEPLEGESIDIGEATAQQLALELDPFPRAPGVAFEMPGEQISEMVEAEDEGGTQANPFAALAALKDKLK